MNWDDLEDSQQETLPMLYPILKRIVAAGVRLQLLVFRRMCNDVATVKMSLRQSTAAYIVVHPYIPDGIIASPQIKTGAIVQTGIRVTV